MSWMILIVGGLLIMMGQHDRSEELFYYFRLEDQVPETPAAVRLIEKHINFAFVREKLKDSYSVAIDSTLNFRCVFFRSAICTASAATKLVEELRMNPWRALVHGTGLRSGDPPSLSRFEKPARTVSRIETVRGTV